ncbi:MAG: Na+/H+ antiporter NhaC family protein [Emergencia timonensis]|uniref:Na+/H+ antiporter NhaC family protein n=1 Tax=Emergencia timonensis TaxID=1776384 RepID=UPI00082B9EAB|nr:Na+/H+ antiporter NhaC family protein [Emergencia timonensis]WNX87961.1 Na+/H+ antiporter NhaC family protein [Emergencia timonensis]
MNESNIKPNGLALLPILVFLILFLGTGIILKDFYTMPAVVGFLIALIVAFMQTRGKSFNEKFSIVARGVGDENIITMCLIFLAAGAFSGSVSAAGGVDSTVNLGLSLLPPSIAVIGLFVIGCFISISMGTSVGTITALVPIAVGISEKTGFAMAICVGAVVSGAMFGDNLSMISDTTIAAVRTQGCEMKDKFKRNFLIVLPAAIVTIVVLFFLTRGSKFKMEDDLDYNILQVIPYLLVLITAIIGVNVFIVLISGTVLSVIVGIATGAMAPSAVFTSIGTGVTNMYDITVISILVASISALVKQNGGFAFILEKIHNHVHTYKGAEFGVAALISLVDAATANNTVAIVIAGPIAKEISEDYDIEPSRSASLLDMFASVFQGIIPYGAQLLTAAALSGLTPFAIIPYLFYPYLMAVCGIVSILLPQKKRSK